MIRDVYQACPLRRSLQETATTSTSTSWADSSEGFVLIFPVCEDEENRTPFSEHPEHAAKAFEKQGALIPLEFDEHVQVDMTTNAGQRYSETPSIPANLFLAPESNAMVHMEIGEAVMKECRHVAMPQVQAKRRESREVSQTYL
jgi:hypothetical protein